MAASDRRARLVVAACAAIGIASSAGCAVLRHARGPAFGDRSEPLAVGSIVRDHRESERLRILVFGDFGTGRERQARVARSMAGACREAGGCDLALTTGDNVYPAGVGSADDPAFARCFEEPYAALGRLDVWLVPGNHDWYRRGSVDAEVAHTLRSERWRMPAHDYAVSGLPPWIRVYALDTASVVAGRDTGQLERAREALCGTPETAWKLLVGHHPLYASGKHAGRRGVLRRVASSGLPGLIRECEVDLYLSGHEHHQELLEADGFHQIVQGAAAAPRRVREIRSRPAHVAQLAASDRPGFALLELAPGSATIRFYGVSDAGKREVLFEGELRHHRSVDRSGREAGAIPCYDAGIMMSRTQISLDPELHRRARKRAMELGVSFAEYVRRLVAEDVGEPLYESSPASVFNLGDSGGADVSREKDAMIGEAVASRRPRGSGA